MKLLFQLAFTFLIGNTAFADCAGTGISFWPTGNTIKQNSIIMVDGYAASRDIVEKLNKDYPIYLKANGHKVKLEVIEILEGEFYLKQAILRPTEKLIAGKEYELYIEGLPEYLQNLGKWNTKTKKRDPIKWLVTEGTDVTSPIFSDFPNEKEKFLEYYGCGPASYVIYDFKCEDDSEYLIRAEVTNQETKKTTAYYLTAREGQIYIGHSMCSGAFKLTNGQEYIIQFDLMDASGNKSANSPKKMMFKAPE
jgi:hypothetical protein